MRYWESSRSLRISLALSIFLHLCLFVYLYYSPPPFMIERHPVAVELIPSPKEYTKVGKSFVAFKKIAAMPRSSANVVEAPSLQTSQESKTVIPPHSIEIQKSPVLPGKEALIPSMEQLAKLTEDARKETSEEETISLDSTDIKYTSYLHGVKQRIEGVWKYPEVAKKSVLQGRGVVSFTIYRDGTVDDLKLLTSSGYPVLDDGILKAIRAAAPFNPMTENMKIKRLNIIASFEYNLVVQPLLY